MRHYLRDLAEIGAGQGAPQGDHNYCEDGVPFVKAGNLQELTAGGSITDIQKVSDEVAKAHKLKLYPKGTVLFAKSGMSCLKGYVYVLPVNAYVVSHLACITPKEDISEYLRLYFTYHRPNQLVKDAAYPSISLADIGNIEIDTKDERTRDHIISALKSAEKVIELRKRELQKLDDLIKTRFVEMFGEESEMGIPLKECCVDVRGGGTPSMKHPEYYGGNVPFIKSGDIRGDLVYSGALWLTEKALEETTAKYVPQGAVLVVNRSAALLREFRAAIAAQPVVINQDIKAFIPKEGFTSEYLLWAIKIQTQYLLTKVTTVLTSHIDLKDLLELRIAPASIERQINFTRFVAQVDKSKFVVQKALGEAQTLFDSLMQQYFG